MRLHLGCGARDFGSDWEHIDASDYPHLKSRSITKLPYPNDSVELIYSSHTLGYFAREEVDQLLQEWARVLTPGGTLRLAVPDFRACAEMYLAGRPLDEFVGMIFGRWNVSPNHIINHKTIYDFDSLSKVLVRNGFTDCHLWDWRQVDHGVFDDYSQAYYPHLEKDSGQLVSLNVEASLSPCFITTPLVVLSVGVTRQDTSLGNTMFQVASVVGLARTNNLRASIPNLDILDKALRAIHYDHTDTVLRNVPTGPISGQARYIRETYCQQYDRDLCQQVATAGENVNVGEYLQSHLYFDHHRDVILDMFSIDARSAARIREKYPVLFDDRTITVSIHVRQHYAKTIYDTAFIDLAMTNMRYLLGADVHFLVCSNDIDWCKGHLPNCTFIEGNPDYIDMWVMSLCKHNIISHSTLAFWGAYLNQNPDQIVMYPEDALRIDGPTLHAEPVHLERKVEFFLPSWQCIPARTIHPEP